MCQAIQFDRNAQGELEFLSFHLVFHLIAFHFVVSAFINFAFLPFTSLCDVLCDVLPGLQKGRTFSPGT
jgi:hypothetical protein